jgi:hypothetical protein
LLASEGGVCGKFNLSNCCLQINDEGKVIEEITNKMKKLAHVPVQTWKGWVPMTWSGAGSQPEVRVTLGSMFLVLGAWLIFPCLIPWYCDPSGPLWKPL